MRCFGKAVDYAISNSSFENADLICLLTVMGFLIEVLDRFRDCLLALIATLSLVSFCTTSFPWPAASANKGSRYLAGGA